MYITIIISRSTSSGSGINIGTSIRIIFDISPSLGIRISIRVKLLFCHPPGTTMSALRGLD